MTLIFVHIPRTAGTTLNYVMNRQYGPGQIYSIYTTDILGGMNAFRALPRTDRLRFKLIRGHVYYGLHPSVDGPSSYITFLRDPIDRAISDYLFTKIDTYNPLSDVLVKRKLTLKEYVESGVSVWTDNVQTRLLAGEAGTEQATPFGQCTDELLGRAKANLDSHFGLVGLSEKFDESSLLGRQKFGWNNCYYVRKNAIQNRMPKSEIAGDTLATLQQFNRLDIALYEHCKKQLDELIHESGPEFRRELQIFRSQNRYAGPVITYLHAAKRRFNALLGKPVHRAH